MKVIKTVRIVSLACATFAMAAAEARDVFSDAASWHRGFVGNGALGLRTEE